MLVGHRPWLHRLRRRLPGFVRRLPRYYGGVRLLTIVHHRLRLLASPTRTRAGRVTYLLANREISRFPYKERPHMPRSATAPGRRAFTLACPSVLPSTVSSASAPGMRSFSRLDSSAYAIPCQRFADTLLVACA